MRECGECGKCGKCRLYLCLVPLDGSPDARGIHEADHALGCRIPRQIGEFLIPFKSKWIVPRMRPIPILTTSVSPPSALSIDRTTYKVHLRQQKHGVVIPANLPRGLELVNCAPEFLAKQSCAADWGAFGRRWRRCVGRLFETRGTVHEDDCRGLFRVVEGLSVESCARSICAS